MGLIQVLNNWLGTKPGSEAKSSVSQHPQVLLYYSLHFPLPELSSKNKTYLHVCCGITQKEVIMRTDFKDQN